MSRYLELARELSRHSPAKQHKLGAVIVRGGAVLSVGVNRNGNCAEKRAIRPHQDYTGAVIYVARQNGRCSRPCHRCQSAIARAGIRAAVYVDWGGSVQSERYSTSAPYRNGMAKGVERSISANSDPGKSRSLVVASPTGTGPAQRV